MKKITCCVILSFMFVTNCCYADSLNFNQHIGPYIEGNLGTNLFYSSIYNTGKVAGIAGIGWSTAVGYHYKNIFALEAGFMQNDLTFDGSSYVNVPYATTRFDVPITNRFNFIGKIGAMYPHTSNERGIVLPFIGVGGSYALTKKVDFQVQYQGAVYGVVGAGMLGAGLTYHFG